MEERLVDMEKEQEETLKLLEEVKKKERELQGLQRDERPTDFWRAELRKDEEEL